MSDQRSPLVSDPDPTSGTPQAAVDDVRRRVQQHTLGHRGRNRDPLYGIRRVLRRHRTRLSTKARARLEAGLIAGDPRGETTLAWTVAQQLMDLYRLDDPGAARTCVEQLIADLRNCPIPELARLGRTPHAWRVDLCTHFDHPDVSNGPTENLNLKIKNTKRIVWVPRTVSRLLTSAFVVAQACECREPCHRALTSISPRASPRRHRPALPQHDRSPWPSDSPT